MNGDDPFGLFGPCEVLSIMEHQMSLFANNAAVLSRYQLTQNLLFVHPFKFAQLEISYFKR